MLAAYNHEPHWLPMSYKHVTVKVTVTVTVTETVTEHFNRGVTHQLGMRTG
jgi:hypothetical protein